MRWNKQHLMLLHNRYIMQRLFSQNETIDWWKSTTLSELFNSAPVPDGSVINPHPI